MTTWTAQAPANIALIKYMGKRDSKRNIPTNASLSYTLPHLTSTVSLSPSNQASDRWSPLPSTTFATPLSTTATQRFLNHLTLIKSTLSYDGYFDVQSANNFPMGCGLASSASSYAALTQCAIQAICQLTGQSEPSISECAQLSRQGSGSSCRSFFAPWAWWDQDTVQSVDLPYTDLHHCVIVLETQPKRISSSQAHQQVQSSPYFDGRRQRAEQRCQTLIDALNHHQWSQAVDLCWQEFMDMHQLFETSSPSFSYRNPACHDLLTELEQQWLSTNRGPIVTMDAGPNIHLLYRAEDKPLAEAMTERCHKAGWRVLHS